MKKRRASLTLTTETIRDLGARLALVGGADSGISQPLPRTCMATRSCLPPPTTSRADSAG